MPGSAIAFPNKSKKFLARLTACWPVYPTVLALLAMITFALPAKAHPEFIGNSLQQKQNAEEAETAKANLLWFKVCTDAIGDMGCNANFALAALDCAKKTGDNTACGQIVADRKARLVNCYASLEITSQSMPRELAEAENFCNRRIIISYFTVKPTFLTPTSNVHETLTKETLNLSAILGRPFGEYTEMPYIKGVYWPDSPHKLLCRWCNGFSANINALRWLSRVKSAQRQATKELNPVLFSHGAPLLERSHYGDLAFIHGMAIREGIPASETRRKILIWAEFVYKVATGRISPETLLQDVSIDGFGELFNDQDSAIYHKSIKYLFSNERDNVVITSDNELRQIAIGTLLHLVQDSYSPSHIERVNHDEIENRFCRGNVNMFLAYANQDGSRHGEADKWPENLPHNTLALSDRICGPVTVGAKILQFYAHNNFAGKDWPEVSQFLTSQVYVLADAEKRSGPGEGFEKSE